MVPEPSESYRNSRVYKHRYLKGDRPSPKRCPVIKKDGTRCKNNCVIGYNCCMNHGGKAAKARITHGTKSKLVELEIMRSLKKLSEEERQDLLATDYNRDKVLEESIMLSDALIARLIDHQNQAIEQKEALIQEMENLENPNPKTLEALVQRMNGLERTIVDASRMIQCQQSMINATLKTKKELREVNENEQTLEALTKQLSLPPEEIIQDMIAAYLRANPGKKVDDLLQLRPASIEAEIVFEDSTDD